MTILKFISKIDASTMQVKQHKLQAIMLHYFSVVLRETVIGQSSNI